MIHTIEVIGEPYGWPRPRRSKSGGVYTPHGKWTEWRKAVTLAALDQFRADPILGPVRLSVVYRLPRPRGHFGTGRNASRLRPSAPRLWHTNKPDRDNLNKGTKDGLTDARVWADDSQVCTGPCDKVWAQPGELPGATITVEEIE